MSFEPEQLADREAIRDVVNRYCHGIDRLDGEWMKSAYWPEAIDDHGVFIGNAWEFVDRVIASHARWRATLHCVFNHQIELDVDGVHARGEAYNVTYLFHADESRIDTWFGRYLDRYEQRDGEWRIIHRVCVHEGSRTDSIEAMGIEWQRFRPGSFDRPSTGRPIGP